MTDNEMMISLIAEIENQLNIFEFPDFEVCRSYQSEYQYAGADEDDSIKTRIFLHSISNPVVGRDRNYNNSKRADIYHKSKVIQVSVLHFFDHSNVASSTTEDVANFVRDLIDSPDAIKNLRNNNVYIQSVGDVRPTYFVDETDRNEQAPSFDVTVMYSNVVTKDSSNVSIVNHNLERV